MEDTTQFAPAERSANEEIRRENQLVSSNQDFAALFGAMTGIGGVINKNRQIVYANKELLDLLGLKSLEPILGKRPGEFIGCIHSGENTSGCGTSLACAYCGAVNSILESQRTGSKAVRETMVSAVVDGKHKSWDLNIISSPVKFDGEDFYILILQDISEEKRRHALERIFFHDLLNSVGALNGMLTLLKEESDTGEIRDLISLSELISRNIIDEILMHRQLRDAENGELKACPGNYFTVEILRSAIGKIEFHESGKGKKIEVSPDSVNIEFETDRILLERVLVNLLKNALEATDPNGTIYSGVRVEGSRVVFWVKNSGYMPPAVQHQLFQRSFSTKGSGRGLGTYSIRLLTENYLEGKVSFSSSESEGTVFMVSLNLKFGEDKK